MEKQIIIAAISVTAIVILILLVKEAICEKHRKEYFREKLLASELLMLAWNSVILTCKSLNISKENEKKILNNFHPIASPSVFIDKLMAEKIIKIGLNSIEMNESDKLNFIKTYNSVYDMLEIM